MPTRGKKAETERGWLRLQESLASRTSRYFQGVGDLIQRRSLEPKEWLTGYSDFWKSVIGDVGDWMLVLAGQKLRPTEEWVQRARTSIQREGTAFVCIDVPDDAFGDDLDEITLVTDGMSRGNHSVIVVPGTHVHFEQPKVRRSERRGVTISFSGMSVFEAGIYSGIVCADETDLTVAIIELEVR